jgi:PB1 domain
LNLPVVDSQNTVIGIVDVLKLTYATLEQINTMNTPEGEGPMWNRFWNTLDNDTESVHSADGVSTSHSARPETPDRHMRDEPPPYNRMTSDSLLPTDSASMNAAQEDFESVTSPAVAPAVPAVKEEFVFKFKSPGGRVHRVRFDVTLPFQDFRDLIAEKLTSDERAVIGGSAAEDAGFGISFVDDEGDIVSVGSQADLLECVGIAKRAGREKVDVYVHHPASPPALEPVVVAVKAEVVEAVERIVEGVEEGGERVKEVVGGVPRELLLPGAIVVLAAVIVGVFIATRAGKR